MNEVFVDDEPSLPYTRKTSPLFSMVAPATRPAGIAAGRATWSQAPPPAGETNSTVPDDTSATMTRREPSGDDCNVFVARNVATGSDSLALANGA
ncbi:MAG: hypothetical protein U0Q22_18950 [Acidimicrobiales bacterium]